MTGWAASAGGGDPIDYDGRDLAQKVLNRESDTYWCAAENVNVVYDTSELSQHDLESSEGLREMASFLSHYAGQRRALAGRSSLFNRGIYAPPDHVYSEMVAARIGVANDDVLGTAAEITEGMAFARFGLESADDLAEDVLNQWATKIRLTARVKEMWRELFTQGQYVAAAHWGPMTFTPEGSTPTGKASKQKITLSVPTGIEVLDSTKIVPIAGAVIGEEYLCWHSTNREMEMWMMDARMRELIVGPLIVTDLAERERLSMLGISPDNLLLLDPKKVWRQTLTRPGYMPFAPVRLKRAFRLLDMKQQLMEADRAALVGAANYILLVRKGSKELPGTKGEIENLKTNFSVAGRVPVIVSDQRLDIEIITPKIDVTLNDAKYNTLDSRLILTALNTFYLGGAGGRSETTVTLGKLIAKGMENRRNEIGDELKLQILDRIVASTDRFTKPVRTKYTPRQVTVDVDLTLTTAVQNARNTRDLSRESYLEYLGFDERIEAERVQWEKDNMDDIFESEVPFNGNGGNGDDPSGGGGGGQGGGGGGDANTGGGAGRPGSTGAGDGQPSSSTAKAPGQNRGGRPRKGAAPAVKPAAKATKRTTPANTTTR